MLSSPRDKLFFFLFHKQMRQSGGIVSSLSGSEPGLSEHRIYNIVISWIYCLTKRFNCSGSTSPSAATGYRPKRDYYSTGEADT